jgi:hypothetical protein
VTEVPTGQEPAEQKPAEPFRFSVPRNILYIGGGLVALLVLLPLGVYGWRVLTVRSLERRMEVQKTEMVENKRQALKVQARDMLRLSARPFAWAVRAEMLRNNLGQVDDYIRQFVREAGIRSLMIVGKDGRIQLASDRKLETQSAEPLVSKEIRNATDVVVEEPGDFIRMGVPVMGFDDRMGVLVVDYAPPPAAP